ncbi:MAG: enoyl-CoA hydratase/isomerase family protein [Chloroflexota bacterium]|uniref:Enoyl-CoA hydratase/isomerase family protein n=1 Tax=marine metagenome TaxID=408172 RepID=A0A381V7F4_9ZZZZ|nr:enoyl-CoA hydratase/isomerase family protein [Chloroflexota bacterium]
MSSSSPFETLLFEKCGAVAHISLNRPQVVNAYNIQMRNEFCEVLSAVEQDPQAQALLITGEGRGFCAGADLTEFGTAPSQVIARQVRWERDVWGQLVNLDKPVIAAVHGYCIGSGLEIALLCDLRIAATGTVFALPEVQLGMIPAAGGTQTLPRAVGLSQALDILLTGRRIQSEEALSIGLVTRLTPLESLWADARRLAGSLAELPAEAVAALKQSLRQGMDLDLARALELEGRLAARLAS